MCVCGCANGTGRSRQKRETKNRTFFPFRRAVGEIFRSQILPRKPNARGSVPVHGTSGTSGAIGVSVFRPEAAPEGGGTSFSKFFASTSFFFGSSSCRRIRIESCREKSKKEFYYNPANLS
uniref:(northern house mosquito) hypothetical protein n=1 Tax=Culex pipiens TaxID=7175 RepID=A0A8D8F490_CULPI